jgi:hypothetical protein
MVPEVPSTCRASSAPIHRCSLFIETPNISFRMQNIITRFTAKLRRLSAKDKLISSNSVSRYVQAVLAPELAVMLVKEDMGVDDEGARALLRDSAALGNLLNEEEDEEIRDEEILNEKTDEMRP